MYIRLSTSALNPRERFTYDGRRITVSTFVFAVRDIVPETFQARDKLPAGVVNGHRRVAQTVRDEDLGFAARGDGTEDAGRHGDDMAEDVASAGSKRQ